MTEPELYVPARERPRRSNWRLSLTRAWCVLGVIVAWFVFISGSRELHLRAAIFTLAGFYVIWRVVAWIFRPALPPDDGQR